jgi:predicted glycosyltransferase
LIRKVQLPPSFPRKKKILYCVLNWGLGHASRSIEVIEELLLLENEVTIASDGNPGSLLRKKFPKLSYVELPPYGVTYPTTNLFINFLANAYRILNASIKEKNQLLKLHKMQPYDLVISDNRPGCNLPNTPNYFITHQLNPYHSNFFVKSLFTNINNHYLNKYREIWVPDYDDCRLSGSLSDSSKVNSKVYYLGSLSAYRPTNEKKERVTILLSGPEPQRTKLENELYKVIVQNESIQYTFIRGTLASNSAISRNLNHVEVVDLCPLDVMNTILNQTKLLISRTGYSTIMDIDRLGIPQAVLIPTTGQTEQEYLGMLHVKRFTILDEKNVYPKLIEFFHTFAK